MDKNSINLEKVLQFLVDGKIVPKDVLPSSDSQLDFDVINKAITEGSEFEYDSILDELSIVMSDGTRIHAPDLSAGLSVSVEWIVDYLPEVMFDLEQGGNLRKGDEAESCYKLLCLSLVISDFKENILGELRKYNFDKMAFDEENSTSSLVDLLQEYQNLNSSRVNTIISAASLKISLFKEKSESYYTGLLESEETSKLSTLSREIKSITSRYEREKGLNPNDMKNMSKITKLNLIDQRDLEIEKVVTESDVGMIYRISKLTSERIPPVVKSVILREAEKAAKEHVKFYSLNGIEADDTENDVRKKIVREAYRAVMKTIKAQEVQSYKNDPSNYKLKVKS